MPSKILENSTVLVTGGAGFIGSNLVEALLENNNAVVCLDNFSTGKMQNVQPFLNHKNFKLFEGDIRDLDTCKKAVKGMEYVLHQAALGSVPRSISDPKTTNDVNIGGFINMLVAAKDEQVKRFVYAASSSTYGDHPGLPKIEDKIGNPLSPYAITKYVNELYAKIFSDLYKIEVIGLRYFNVFGRRQDPDGAYAAVIPKFLKLLIDHSQPVIYGDGLQSRDFTYVENVVQANQLAAVTNNPGAINTVYNIAVGERTNLNDLVFNMVDLLSTYDKKIKNIKPNYSEDRPGDVKHSLASIEKAGRLLGYNPRYKFYDGLKEAIDWYWNHLK